MANSGDNSAHFATTQWSMVLAAGQGASSRAALAELCQRYWYPLYCYVRRRTVNAHEAQDLTQAFFVRLLEHDVLAEAVPERGRFRNFLLASLTHFLANEHDRALALKRGGGVRHVALDFDAGESRWNHEPSHSETPERLYQRQWALALLARTIERLEAELKAAGKLRQWELLNPVLIGDRPTGGHGAVAAELGTSEQSVRQTASRLRKRYRQVLRDEIAQTVANPEDIDDELREMQRVLGSPS